MKITKQTTIGNVLEKAGNNIEKVAEILMSSGMGCVGCPCAQMETLEQGCRAHGLSNKEVEEVVKKINGVLKE